MIKMQDKDFKVSWDHTMKFAANEENRELKPDQVMLAVYEALKDKGYQPVNQIVGYILSGDPAYIPRHNNARNIIRKIERDDLIEELVTFYLEHHKNGKT